MFHHILLTFLPWLNEHVCLRAAGLQWGSAVMIEGADAESPTGTHSRSLPPSLSLVVVRAEVSVR